MKTLVEYRDILDYAIYRRAVETIFPLTHYEITTELKEHIEATQEGCYQFLSTGYTFMVYHRADISSPSRPCCEIKIEAPGSRTLTSDIDTSIYVNGADTLDLTYADSHVKDKGPDYNGRVRNQVIAHFYHLSEELHHMTSSESRDSNAYMDKVTEDEKEHPKFNFTESTNPSIHSKPFLQDNQFYANHKLIKHYQEQAASLVSLRQALTLEEWKIFKQDAIAQLQKTFTFIYHSIADKSHLENCFKAAQTDIINIFTLVETLCQTVEQESNATMSALKQERADYWASSPLSNSPEQLAADIMTSAQNTLYIDYLEKMTNVNNDIIELERKNQNSVDQLERLYQQQTNVLREQITLLENQLRANLKQRADQLLAKQLLQIKAHMFASGAYVNRSAVYHVVKGIQRKDPVQITKQTVMGSALQQIGFRLHHADKLRDSHKPEGEITYYCAKYGQRVFDLLLNNDDNAMIKTPFTDEEIENLAKGSKDNTLKVLSLLKSAELQDKFPCLFTREEYHLINSEMRVITQVKKSTTIAEEEKPAKTLELVKERMQLIDAKTYPDKGNISDEEIQVFAKTVERNLFKSLAVKLMAAVYAAKLEVNHGYLWGRMNIVQKQTQLASVALISPSTPTLFLAPSQSKRVWMSEILRNLLYPALDKLSILLKSQGFMAVLLPSKFQSKTSVSGWQLYSITGKDEHWAVLNLAHEAQAQTIIAAINSSKANLKAKKMRCGDVYSVAILFSTAIKLADEIDQVIAQLAPLSVKIAKVKAINSRKFTCQDPYTKRRF